MAITFSSCAYPELVTLYILYGDVLLMEKNTRESVKAYEKSLQLASQNFGSVNSLTEKVYRRLSKVYQQLKAYEKAIFYFNKVLTYLSKNSFNKDAKLIDEYRHLGFLWEQNGNLSKAKHYYSQVYQSCIKSLGIANKQTSQVKAQLEKVIAKLDKN